MLCDTFVNARLVKKTTARKELRCGAGRMEKKCDMSFSDTRTLSYDYMKTLEI